MRRPAWREALGGVGAVFTARRGAGRAPARGTAGREDKAAVAQGSWLMR
jgi:hypothetical protein